MKREADSKILKLYMAGVPVTEIKDMFGVTREAIYQRLRRAEGWKGMKRYHSGLRASTRLTELQGHTEEIVSEWLGGVSMVDLAKKYKTTRKNISEIIKLGAGSTRRNYKRDLKIVEEYKDGVTQVKLSKKYNISQPCISRIVRTSE